MKYAKLVGLDRAIKNLNKAVENTKAATKEGLIAGAFELQREAVPRTPIDLGNLRHSFYVVWQGGRTAEPSWNNKRGDAAKIAAFYKASISSARTMVNKVKEDKEIRVEAGYGAFYAVYVHEGGPRAGGAGEKKFFENAINSSHKAVLDKVTQKAKRG